jgi:hypothetical protein
LYIDEPASISFYHILEKMYVTDPLSAEAFGIVCSKLVLKRQPCLILRAFTLSSTCISVQLVTVSIFYSYIYIKEVEIFGHLNRHATELY